MNSAAYSGLIVDHHHVHPQSALFAINTKGAHRIMLVTDAMAHVGSDITRLPFFDTEIIRQGDKLTTPEGTLAGSCLDMHSALVNTCRDLNVTLAKASEMASLTPARFVGLDDEIGVIASGYRANFVALDETLNLCNVWVNGELIARG
jgi:N-acetylglucosamine-6-phosphate deacetylase